MKNLEIQDFFIKKLIVGFLVRSRVIFSENPDGNNNDVFKTLMSNMNGMLALIAMEKWNKNEVGAGVVPHLVDGFA